jgi:hypothetical protein
MCMIMPDAPLLPFEVSSRHTSGGIAYEQDQRKKGNPEPVNAYEKPKLEQHNSISFLVGNFQIKMSSS